MHIGKVLVTVFYLLYMSKKSAKTKNSPVVAAQKVQIHRLVILFFGVCIFVVFLASYFYWQMQQIGVRIQQLEGTNVTTSQGY